MECCLCFETTNENVIQPCKCPFYRVHKTCLPCHTIYCGRCKYHYNKNEEYRIDLANVTNFQEYMAGLRTNMNIMKDRTLREFECKYGEMSEEFKEMVSDFFTI
jgi:hypothetical protein